MSRLEQRPSVRQRLGQQCRVCRQLRNQAPPADLAEGARQFDVCYECRQPVSRPSLSEAYKRRWTYARERATLSQRVSIRVTRGQWDWFRDFAATQRLTPSELLDKWISRAADRNLAPSTRKGTKRR